MRENGNHRPIIDAAPILVWASGSDRRPVFFNKQWLEFTGRTLDEQLAHDWIESVYVEDFARCASIYSHSFARREAFQFQCRLRRRNDEYRWVMASGAPRFMPSGAFAGFVGAAIEIHDSSLSTDEGEAGVRRLSSIGRMAAGIAHDFNNLLANILANAELALAEVLPGSHAAEPLERIRTVAMRGSEIVRGLMVYAGLEQPRTEALDLSKLVEEMLEMLRISVTKHARITTDLAPRLSPVVAEPAEVRELLMNLILNASDALGEKDGEIRISTSRVKSVGGAPAQEAAGGGEGVKLVVADTGPGIAQSVRNRIFDPFVSTKTPGRGVGLAIVRTIVQKYDGTIRVRSSPGRGTRFTVLLPCAAKHTTPEGPRFIATDDPVEGQTVLVVEDEEGLRLAISQLLRRYGFRIFEAQDGSSALERLRNNSHVIDTILLDLTIPGIPSHAVIEEAARIDPDIRIVLTSAYHRSSAAAIFKAPQVKGFVRKPYQVRELVRLLKGEVYAALASGDARR